MSNLQDDFTKKLVLEEQLDIQKEFGDKLIIDDDDKEYEFV